MRNKMEGHFTRWHEDIAYVHLYDAFLKRLYPEKPTPQEVLEWRTKRQHVIENERLQNEHGDATEEQKEEVKAERASIQKKDREWAPAPHESAFGTPIPLHYFREAKGAAKGKQKWCLWTRGDLVPHEQEFLLQDGYPAQMRQLRSMDALACISCCRPVGQFSERRDLGRGRSMPTHMHQSGALPLQPLYPAQDAARGMLCSIVTKESFQSEFFDLQDGEQEALRELLPWLHAHNPWLNAYKESLKDVNARLEEVRESFRREGRLLPGGLENIWTAKGATLAENLGEEGVALLLPSATLRAYTDAARICSCRSACRRA